VKYLGTATLPLPIAAEEAWMSIMALERTAHSARFFTRRRLYMWAAAQFDGVVKLGKSVKPNTSI
jgi:hypothetical protein